MNTGQEAAKHFSSVKQVFMHFLDKRYINFYFFSH